MGRRLIFFLYYSHVSIENRSRCADKPFVLVVPCFVSKKKIFFQLTELTEVFSVKKRYHKELLSMSFIGYYVTYVVY